jgi:HD-GYP domain-containing protein (c-di-GMP phosphodiesterase class II)
VVGHQIVSSVQFPWPKIHEAVRWHHERCDGSGYPDALRGDELPMPVRIMAVADTFDAMTSKRPYRESLPLGNALTDLIRMTPQKYDPDAVQAFFIQIRREAVGSGRVPLLADHMPVNIAPTDVDQLAATLQHKVSNGKTYRT